MNTHQLTFGSLFSGIGGIDLGLERAGMKPIWMCEIEPYARKVLNKHWPNILIYEDIRKIDETVKQPDVLCGGFPCQDVSCAGKRAGLNEGTRTGLWFEFARVIRSLRPRYALLENVPGLLSLGFGRVLGDLAEIGYDAEWQVLSAAQFGAQHLRRRLFIVAYPQSEQNWGIFKSKLVTNTGAKSQSIKIPHPQGIRLNNGADSIGVYSTQNCKGIPMDTGVWLNTEPNVGRMVNGVPNRVDRLRCLGNAVVPQIAEYIGKLIIKHSQSKNKEVMF